METLLLVLLILAAILISSVIDQLVPRVSLPLVQIGLGVVIAFLSVSPIDIDIDPNLFLVLFIAPIIFDESKRIDKAVLWRERKPIISLAIGLVVVAALVVGFCVNLLIPSIPLAAAFALGAALGPTDAVAVSSLSQDSNISSRQKKVLEYESIINDASGIVSFQFALAAVVTSAFSLLDASISFVFAFAGGILIGVVLAYIFGFAIRKIRDLGLENTTFHVLFEVCIPFVIYMVANALGVSPILALVAAGLMNVMSPRTMGPAESRLNIVSNSVWQVITFALNGFVFVLLGMLLPGNMQAEWTIDTVSNYELIAYIFIITLVLTIVRFAWIFAMQYLEKRRFVKEGKLESARFGKEDWRHCGIMTFAGARGAITLALVLSLPILLSNGNAFPQRSLIIFLAAGVIILTLLMATFIVPLLAPSKENSPETQRMADAGTVVAILRTVIEELTARETPENRAATREVIRSYNQRISRIKEDSDDFDSEPNKELRLQTLQWEQEYTFDLIDRQEVDPIVGYLHLNRLARVQNLIKHKSENRWMLQQGLRHFKLILQSLFSSISAILPGSTKAAERAEQTEELTIKCQNYVIEKLQEEISNPETATEEASELLIEYQRTLITMRSSRFDKDKRISMTALTQLPKNRTEVERIGLQIELEQIQAMYEEGKLSRSAAKRMRENVSLMQIDLEDHI